MILRITKNESDFKFTPSSEKRDTIYLIDSTYFAMCIIANKSLFTRCLIGQPLYIRKIK